MTALPLPEPGTPGQAPSRIQAKVQPRQYAATPFEAGHPQPVAPNTPEERLLAVRHVVRNLGDDRQATLRALDMLGLLKPGMYDTLARS